MKRFPIAALATFGIVLAAGPGARAQNTSCSTNVTGGVFQVGANVTTQNQISVSISDVRITGGTNTTYSNLAAISHGRMVLIMRGRNIVVTSGGDAT